jgi:hypothetical protein
MPDNNLTETAESAQPVVPDGRAEHMAFSKQRAL